MSNQLMTKAFVAQAAIAAYTVVKFGSADGSVVAAAAASDLMIGVIEGVPADAGERCDVMVSGIADVKAGGTITRGSPVTADSSGRVVAAASTNRQIGIAMESAVAGDIIGVLLVQTVV